MVEDYINEVIPTCCISSFLPNKSMCHVDKPPPFAVGSKLPAGTYLVCSCCKGIEELQTAYV